MSCIVNHNLFLGDMTNANDVEFIARNNITTIINMKHIMVVHNTTHKLQQTYHFIFFLYFIYNGDTTRTPPPTPRTPS